MSEPATAARSGGRRRTFPLGVRIAATALAVFLIAATAAGIYLGREVTGLANREAEENFRAAHDMLTPAVRAALAQDDRAMLASIASGAADSGFLRATIILADGTVVGESEHRLPMPSHADRPEVREAMSRGFGSSERTSTTTGDPYVYYAWRVDAADGRPLGILRLARPRRSVATLEGQVFRVLLIAGLLGLPVAAVLGWLAARRIARPLEEMTAAAGRMAAGDFEHPPRAERPDEAGRLADALGRMGVELSEMLRVREEQRAELEAVLESMAEGVLAVDRGGRVLLANKAVAECLGLREVPSQGTPIQEVVRLPEITALLRRALEGRRAPEADVTLPGAAGRVLGIGAAPIRGRGDASGAVIVLRDVTVVRRLERTRLDFVANVSHELRTPLAAVLAALETVRDLGDEEPETRGRMLDTAARHGRRLADIVGDLLVLSQIESEGDRLERGPVPVLRAIRSAAAAVAADAKARDVAVTLPAPDAPEVQVLGHEGRLEQVWTNLLANAIKYNRAGGSVAVEVTVDAPGRAVEVSVADTGPGIPAEHLPRIFERFYRVDKGRSRDQGGTGLGLAIVKHIVRSHRGSVTVDSDPGRGSTFRVRLPLAVAPPGAPEAPGGPPPTA